MGFLVFMASWFVAGVLANVICWVMDMRGKEFDADYFKKQCTLRDFLLVTVVGYISLLTVILMCLDYESARESFTRFIYDFVNIGVKKNDND